MRQKSITKDEQFLLKLYEFATQAGDIERAFDRFAIGRAIGQNDRGANIIARDLVAANFVKKGEGDAVYLTAHGLCLIKILLNSR